MLCSRMNRMIKKLEKMRGRFIFKTDDYAAYYQHHAFCQKSGPAMLPNICPVY